MKDKISQNFVCYWKSDRIYNTMKNFRRNFSAIVNDMPAGIGFTIQGQKQEKKRKRQSYCRCKKRTSKEVCAWRRN